ncbi:MAG: glutamate 5-kinase [Epsilonproteobacteria bacterium]|nr:glutamate 5-kinase [Campylobacterota bacterium]OIO15628.1 MAG: glutamate 5-kinase [Helicobacteraceae bacterium CG1_02_36_14]PIP09617.1 MAG: glutamate 5-kinase [Sulfurimonas sp. CG23_combo_of_CG06-09_8_20_14_all_36_33]PIS26162.1 MAG: glutamate 5-kinase [Sulfurimonas sp. CG08_land_8_20_14_0_20_36_33]PIU34245.1 MAG: glutamate 5-kinase [Sulfurimonas sp. CG07_land_8_20_14_0_80_36_56]PIV02543.1 MAG: glutamate 5-kinase [Sulfurimonas sp. CG03_land_8_20_14_0_80_36_25]PIV34640.1 MAG: glutamate 5-kin
MSRIVIKVGSAVLTHKNKIAKERMLNLVHLIVKLKEKFEVVLVTSGAVAAGYSALKLDKTKQIGKKAIAAAGQPILMTSYKKKFDIFDIDTAQILLTEDDFDSRKRTKMFQDIIDAHLSNDILPIINENDITSTPEQLFGDNDQLSANVAHAIKANLLVILSDIDGYYDKNPQEYEDAKLFKIMNELPKGVLEDESTPNNPFATGGIVTKLKAADFMMKQGRKMFLTNGFDLTAAESFLLHNTHTLGTLFEPKTEKEK